MMKKARYVLAAAVATLAFNSSIGAQEAPDKERAELAKDVGGAKVSLEKGLLTSAAEGKPISAKFEIDEGKLQLSVYTAKSNKFYEVIVDHQTGKVIKTEGITEGEDLAAAKSQSEAVARAKLSLREAVSKAVGAHKGFVAVSILPEIKDGHPVAAVSLVKGQEWETVTEGLD